MAEDETTVGDLSEACDPVAGICAWIEGLPSKEKSRICMLVLSHLSGAEMKFASLKNADAYIISWLTDARGRAGGGVAQILAIRAAVDFIYPDQLTSEGFGKILREKREAALDMSKTDPDFAPETTSLHEDLSRIQIRESCGESWKRLREAILSDHAVRLYAIRQPLMSYFEKPI